MLLLLGAAIAVAASAAPTTTTWQPHEITLTSSVAYSPQDAWRTVQLNASFTDGSGAALLGVGYWDGGTSWKLRFAPPSAGEWKWHTSCSDVTNSGLHGASGSFTAAAYSGTNPLYQHGILRPNKANRYLEHADGTPFYWLGDVRAKPLI